MKKNLNPAFPVVNAVLPGQVLVNSGDVTGNGIPGGTIDTITFTIGPVPGEKSVNTENIPIVYADAIRTESRFLSKVFVAILRRVIGGFSEVQNEVGNPNNRLEYEERFVIRLNPKAPLAPRQFITIIKKPISGPSMTIRRVSPPTIIKRE